MDIEFDLLPHQYDFVSEVDSRFLGLVAGYGSGKTFAFCVKGIYLAYLNPGFDGCLLEPTNAMASDILVPSMIEILTEYDIPYTYRASPYPTFTIHMEEGDSKILIRSAENYTKLVGLTLAWFGVDEVDTIQKKVAWKMWRVMQSRLRAPAEFIQGFTCSTPEGFSWLYEFFIKEPKDKAAKGQTVDDRIIQHAKSTDNPYNDDKFVESLIANYPANLQKAYIDGQFCNLEQSTVYEMFDRAKNHTNLTMEDFDERDKAGNVLNYATLHIGIDFNVGKCCGIVHCVNDRTKMVYAVDEMTGLRNTQAIIDHIRDTYPDRYIIVYPDSSGGSEKTNAATTDLRLLNAAGFKVRARTKNPPVRDRINSVNAMFCNGAQERRYYVNTDKCIVYTEALETQAYDKYGKPDKQHDADHPVDASGYCISLLYPIQVQSTLRSY